MFNNFFLENRAVYEIMWKNMVKAEEATNDVTTWRTCFVYRISKATRTHANAHAHAPGHTHARAHTHTNMQHVLLFHGNNDSRARFSVTLYEHCLC
jgi:hypothetical protein